MGRLKTDIISGEVRLNASPAQKELNQLAKNTTELTKANERLRQEKTRLQLAENKDAAAIKEVNAQISRNNLEVKRNNVRMEELQKTIGYASLSKTQLTRKSRMLQRQLDATSKSANPQEYKRLEKELRQVNRQLDKVRRGASATQRMMNTAKSFGAGMLGAFSVTAVVSGIADLTKSLFGLSMKMEGDSRRANIVFGDSLKYVEEQAGRLSKKMGVTKNEFIATASATADLLIPLDFTRDQAAKMSVQLQSLTGALDEWTSGQVGAEEVSAILTKAMLGENEQLKRLGIAIRKDSDEFKDLVKQKLATSNATKAQAEAMATLELIQKKSADAQRAYLTEGNKLLRTQKQLSRWWRNLKEGVVEYFNVSKIEKLQKERIALNKNVESLIIFNDNQKRRKEYIKKIQAIYPSFFENMDTERMKVEQIRDRLKEVNAAFVTRIKLAATSQQLQQAEEVAMKAQMEVFSTIDKMPANLKKAIADYEAGIITLEELQQRKHANDTAIGTFGTTPSSQGRGAGEGQLRNLIDQYINLQGVINSANEKQKELMERKSGLESVLGVKNTDNEDPEPTYTPSEDDPDKDKEDSVVDQIQKWKEQAKALTVQAQKEIAEAKIAAMEDGYEKEKSQEELRWQDELTKLEARKIQKAEGQEELTAEQLAANNALNMLIEEQEAAHQQRLDDIKEQHKAAQKESDDEARLIKIEEEIVKAEEEDVAFEEKLALAQERYDLEMEQADGNRTKELAARKQFNASIDKLQEEQHRKEAARRQATEGLAKGLFNNMKAMAKKGSALSKALYLFEQAMAIRQVINNTQIANAKAVAASPLTGGMPWVAINTALGAASVGLIVAQTASEFKGKEDGGYLDVRREQDGKMFRAKHRPSFRGYTQGPTVITGENGMEFVANAKAAQNPTVRPFLDIIDAAQRQGTIETLDLSAIRAERYRGKEDGGYINPPEDITLPEPTNDKNEERYEKTLELLEKLAKRPIEFSLLKFDEAKATQQEIDNDTNR